MKELDVVRLKSAVPGGGGWTDDVEVPAGALGTIVHVHEPRFEVEFADDAGKTLRVATILEHDLERVPPFEPVRVNVSERIRNSRPLGKVILAAEEVALQWALGDMPSEESLERLHKAITAHNGMQEALDRCEKCGQVVCECPPAKAGKFCTVCGVRTAFDAPGWNHAPDCPDAFGRSKL